MDRLRPDPVIADCSDVVLGGQGLEDGDGEGQLLVTFHGHALGQGPQLHQGCGVRGCSAKWQVTEQERELERDQQCHSACRVLHTASHSHERKKERNTPLGVELRKNAVRR